MTGILGLAIPPYVKWIGIGLVAFACTTAGAWVDHKLMDGKVARAQTETAIVQRDFSSYKAQAAANAAKAAQDYAEKQRQLQASLEAVQAKLAKEKSESDKKSKQLQELLHNAPASDSRPIGPTVRDYLERLRGP